MIDCFCATARRAARLLTSMYDAELSGAGLSASQFEVLTLLSYGDRNGRGIASALALDTTTVSRNLRPLLAENLIEAKPSVEDARQLRYRLTPTGKARLRKAKPLWERAQCRVASRFQDAPDHVLTTLTSLADVARPEVIR